MLRIFRQHTHFEYDDKNVDPSEASFSLLGWVVRYNNESYHVSGPTLVLCIGVHHYVLYTITQWYFKQELKLTSHQKNPNWKQALWLALVPLRLITHFCQWRSQRSSWGCGGTHAFPLRSTSVCYRHSAERLWIVSQWSLTWSGEGTATLLMLYRTTVHSKLEYGWIVYGKASSTNLRQQDSIGWIGFV